MFGKETLLKTSVIMPKFFLTKAFGKMYVIGPKICCCLFSFPSFNWKNYEVFKTTLTSLVSKSDGDESKHEVLAPGDLTQLSLNLYKRDGFLLDRTCTCNFIFAYDRNVVKIRFFFAQADKKKFHYGINFDEYFKQFL